MAAWRVFRVQRIQARNYRHAIKAKNMQIAFQGWNSIRTNRNILRKSLQNWRDFILYRKQHAIATTHCNRVTKSRIFTAWSQWSLTRKIQQQRRNERYVILTRTLQRVSLRTVFSEWREWHSTHMIRKYGICISEKVILNSNSLYASCNALAHSLRFQSVWSNAKIRSAPSHKKCMLCYNRMFHLL